jgi:hypothetical protein
MKGSGTYPGGLPGRQRRGSSGAGMVNFLTRLGVIPVRSKKGVFWTR